MAPCYSCTRDSYTPQPRAAPDYHERRPRCHGKPGAGDVFSDSVEFGPAANRPMYVTAHLSIPKLFYIYIFLHLWDDKARGEFIAN